jgi:hypothetical protein
VFYNLFSKHLIQLFKQGKYSQITFYLPAFHNGFWKPRMVSCVNPFSFVDIAEGSWGALVLYRPHLCASGPRAVLRGDSFTEVHQGYVVG